MVFLNDLKFFMPEMFLITSLLALTLFSVTPFYFDRHGVAYKNLSTEGVLLSILILLIVTFLVMLQPAVNSVLFESQIVISFFGHFSKFIVLLLCIFSLIFSYNYFKWEIMRAVELPFLMVAALTGMIIIIEAADFIIFYLAIELQSLCFYLLTASKKYSNLSIEAGLKYFILGSLASGFLLFGMSIMYGYTGTTNLFDLNALAMETSNSIITGLELGLLFIFMGIAFKLPAAPLHNWAPDVYSGAPTIITSFFVLVPKLPMIAFMTYLSYFTFPLLFYYWSYVFIFFGLTSLIVGCFGALYQTNIKRFVAYSTINHVGFVLLALSTGTVEGISAALFYVVVYIVMNVGFFAAILGVRRIFGIKMVLLEDVFALYRSYPLVSIGMSIILFSMAGIPPLIGFFSKFYVINALVKNFEYLEAVIVVLVSVISCFYYIRIVKNMYFSTNSSNWKKVVFMPYEIGFLFSFSILLNIVFFYFLNIFYVFISNFALTLIM